jgi:hypothetical protein
MNKIFAGLALLFPVFALAAPESYVVTECENRDDYFVEDALTIDRYHKTAAYSPNGDDIIIPCAPLEGDIYVCANDLYTVKVHPDGNTWVRSDKKKEVQSVQFDCSID